MHENRAFLALILAANLLLGACVTTAGSRTVPAARFDYNQAITRSRDEQMLLNLVRLRYRDTPFFLEVGDVVTQYELAGTASAGATLEASGSSGNEYTLGIDGSYTERPTVTYKPLQGEDFVKRLSSAIDAHTLLLLSQSGWSIERLMLCCVEALNGIYNFPSASGPTPDTVPASYMSEYQRFERLGELLRKLQIDGSLRTRTEITVEAEKDDPSGKKTLPRTRDLRITLDTPDLGEIEERELAEVRELLGFRDGTGKLELQARSLLGVLFYLSQGVEAPAAHVEAGLVTRTTGPDGAPFDWRPVSEKLLRIASSRERPKDAFVKVRYRGHWFYVADADLNSKTTFFLLSYLFALQSAGTQSSGTVLTLSAGG